MKAFPLLSRRPWQTLLHVAASNGHDYTLECHVKRGADINIQNYDGVILNGGRVAD